MFLHRYKISVRINLPLFSTVLPSVRWKLILTNITSLFTYQNDIFIQKRRMLEESGIERRENSMLSTYVFHRHNVNKFYNRILMSCVIMDETRKFRHELGSLQLIGQGTVTMETSCRIRLHTWTQGFSCQDQFLFKILHISAYVYLLPKSLGHISRLQFVQKIHEVSLTRTPIIKYLPKWTRRKIYPKWTPVSSVLS